MDDKYFVYFNIGLNLMYLDKILSMKFSELDISLPVQKRIVSNISRILETHIFIPQSIKKIILIVIIQIYSSEIRLELRLCQNSTSSSLMLFKK